LCRSTCRWLGKSRPNPSRRRSRFKQTRTKIKTREAREATMEQRTTDGKVARLEIRTEEGKPPKIEGYGAVFYRDGDPGTEYQLWADAYERVLPGAFDRAMKEDDVRSLFNHDPNMVLGRVAAGTLSLSIDATGLRYSVTPPETAIVREQVLLPIDRGDVSGSSFMFRVKSVRWSDEERDGRMVEIREIQEVELFELGPVTFPAYEATTTGIRSASMDLEEIRRECKLHRRNAGSAALKAAAVRVAAARARAWLGA